MSLFSEFRKAIGLKARGVGVGSFVYLRRVTERLLEDAHISMKNTPNWDEERYSKSKVEERIELLESALPVFMVRNRKLYGILSKGIHELSEEECLDQFDAVKMSIELILDQTIESKEKERKTAMAAKVIGGTAETT